MSEPGDDDFEEPGEPDPVLKDILTNHAPAPPATMELARGLVDRAVLKFKDFRVDRENIENNAVRASREEGHISPKQARDIFMDKGDCISLPLVQRYLDMREFELIAKYLRTRLYYHGFTRMTPRNRLAFDGMIAGGEAAMAVGLLRLYLKKVHQAAQRAWREAGKKMPGNLPAEYHDQFLRQVTDAVAELPGKLQIAEYEVAEIEPYIAAHGSREDNRAIAKFREDIAKVRTRFNIG